MRPLEVPDIPAWTSQGLCGQADPDAWHPAKGERTDLARAICRRCPVQPECLEAGLSEPYGIWGGTTPAERQAIRQRRRELSDIDADRTGRAA